MRKQREERERDREIKQLASKRSGVSSLLPGPGSPHWQPPECSEQNSSQPGAGPALQLVVTLSYLVEQGDLHPDPPWRSVTLEKRNSGEGSWLSRRERCILSPSEQPGSCQATCPFVGPLFRLLSTTSLSVLGSGPCDPLGVQCGCETKCTETSQQWRRARSLPAASSPRN